MAMSQILEPNALMEVAQLIEEHSGRKVRLVQRGCDSNHQLMIGRKPIGKRIEVYQFMTASKGWHAILPDFLEEVIAQLVGDSELRAAFILASGRVQQMGRAVYTNALRSQWDDLFKGQRAEYAALEREVEEAAKWTPNNPFMQKKWEHLSRGVVAVRAVHPDWYAEWQAQEREPILVDPI